MRNNFSCRLACIGSLLVLESAAQFLLILSRGPWFFGGKKHESFWFVIRVKVAYQRKSSDKYLAMANNGQVHAIGVCLLSAILWPSSVNLSCFTGKQRERVTHVLMMFVSYNTLKDRGSFHPYIFPVFFSSENEHRQLCGDFCDHRNWSWP